MDDNAVLAGKIERVPEQPQREDSELVKKAKFIAASGFMGPNVSASQIIALLELYGDQEKGFKSLPEFSIIQGRPAIKSDALLARFQAAGGRIEYKELSDTKVIVKAIHPSGEIEVSWDMARAKQAGLGGNVWQKYPRQMLRARAVAEAIRAVYPAISMGVYTEDEVREFDKAYSREILPTGRTDRQIEYQENNQMLISHEQEQKQLKQVSVKRDDVKTTRIKDSGSYSEAA